MVVWSMAMVLNLGFPYSVNFMGEFIGVTVLHAHMMWPSIILSLAVLVVNFAISLFMVWSASSLTGGFSSMGTNSIEKKVALTGFVFMSPAILGATSLI